MLAEFRHNFGHKLRNVGGILAIKLAIFFRFSAQRRAPALKIDKLFTLRESRQGELGHESLKLEPCQMKVLDVQ